MSVVALCELPSKPGSDYPLVLENELPLYGGCTPADIGVDADSIRAILGTARLGAITIRTYNDEGGKTCATGLEPDENQWEFSRPGVVIDVNTDPLEIRMNELAHRGKSNIDASAKGIDEVLRRAIMKAACQHLILEPIKNSGGAITSLVGAEAVTGASTGPLEMVGMWALLQTTAAGVSLRDHKKSAGSYDPREFRPGIFPFGFQPERFAAVVAALKIEPDPFVRKVTDEIANPLPARFRTVL